MTLTEPKHDSKSYRNNYCGPSAISIVTGITCECAAGWARHFSGKPAIRGMDGGLVLRVLKHLGCTVGNLRWAGLGGRSNPTLNQWAKNRKDRKQTYLVCIGSHWVIVKGNFLYDNQEKKVPLTKTKHKRKRVNYFYPIVSNRRHRSDKWPESEFLPEITQDRLERRKAQTEINKALREANCTIEKDGDLECDGWVIDFPRGKSYDGCHCYRAFSYEEILDIVKNLDDCPSDCDCLDEEI